MFFISPMFLLVLFLFSPILCPAQNAWNTEMIGITGHDNHFRDYDIYDNYLYAITEVDDYQLVIVDISDPSRPRRQWSMFRGNINTAIVVVDDYLYLASPDGDSIIIYTLQDPTLPMEVARVDAGIGALRFQKLNDTYIGSFGYGDTYLINIEDPLNPRVIFTLDVLTNAQDALIVGDYAYIAGAGSPAPYMHLEIYDISDTVSTSRIFYSSVSDGTVASIARLQNFLFFTSVYHGLKILDISDLTNPVLIDSLINDYSILDICVSDHYAYLIGDFDSLLVLDVADPTVPSLLNSIYVQDRSEGLRLDRDRLYFSTGSGIFQIFDVTDPVNAVLDGRYIVGCATWDLAKWGDYIYAVNSYGGIRVFDISDRTNPFGMAYYTTPNQTHRLHIDNGILAVADNNGGALVFSLDDPANPELLSVIDSMISVYGVYVDDNYLFMSDQGFMIADISDPGDPEIIGSYPSSSTHNSFYAIVVYNEFAYTAEADSGLCVYIISDPTNPQRLGSFDSGNVRDLFIQDTLLFAADIYEGMKIFDITDPTSPVLLSTTPPGQAYSICADGDFAYQVYKNDIHIGFRTFDITEPRYPVLVGTFDRYGFCTGVFAENDTVYVSAGNGGIWILRYRAPTDVYNDNTASIPASLSLSNYPNPFNAATTIRYTISRESEVSIAIYNLLGQKVETLFDGINNPGEHSITWDASDVPSGIYFARLERRGIAENIKMVLLK